MSPAQRDKDRERKWGGVAGVEEEGRSCLWRKGKQEKKKRFWVEVSCLG